MRDPEILRKMRRSNAPRAKRQHNYLRSYLKKKREKEQRPILIGDWVWPEGVCWEKRATLKSITISDSVTRFSCRAFRGCKSLPSITIPDSVTSIGEAAFQGCSSLTSITIPDSVTSIDKCAFSDCSSLTSVVMSNAVASISVDTFYKCTSLTSVVVPKSVTSIGDGAFRGCSPGGSSLAVGHDVDQMHASGARPLATLAARLRLPYPARKRPCVLLSPLHLRSSPLGNSFSPRGPQKVKPLSLSYVSRPG